MGFRRGISVAMAAGVLFAGPVAVLAQAVTSAEAAPPVGADGKPLTFDVVSIREDNSEDGPQNTVQNGPTPDGYHLKDGPLLAVIQTAYLPSEGGLTFRPDRITGLPAWAFNLIHYDIDARVSEGDMPKWKDPASQTAMLRAMLQAMFHRENKVIPIYELTVGRKNPKFKPSEATALAEIRQKHPNVVTLRSGTFVVAGPNPGQQTLFGMTMRDLGTFLSTLARRPIQDKTGLTGKYDITFQIELRPPPQEGTDTAIPPDFYSSQIFSIVQDQLALKLNAAKGLVESLVIDHVERPSAN